MTHRITIDGQSYDFLTDEFEFGQPSVRGDQWVMLDNSLKQDIRGLSVPLRISAVWEQVAGPEVSAAEVWRLALAAANDDKPTEVTPDIERAFTIDMYPDIQRTLSGFYRTRKGMAQRGQTLHFRSAKVFAPTDQQLIDLAEFQSSLQSQ